LTNIAPVTVIIPTYNRGQAFSVVLDKIQDCDPKPAEIWIHVDSADNVIGGELKSRFPDVGVLTSSIRLGPGGGRHRCLLSCSTPYAVSFDDDSYPIDSDFFGSVERIFSKLPHAAILGASIRHRHEPEKIRTRSLVQVTDYVGCGCAVRLAAYRQVRGYLPRPVAYGMEERDLSLQLFAAGLQIYESGDLRVFHDTDLEHHQSPEITSGVIANVGLYAFLHYPISAWGLGVAQVANKVAYCIRKGRVRGIVSGVLSIPRECYCNRQYRRPIARQTLNGFQRLHKIGAL
jgi:GT2 family glycosyltransferase